MFVKLSFKYGCPCCCAAESSLYFDWKDCAICCFGCRCWNPRLRGNPFINSVFQRCSYGAIHSLWCEFRWSLLRQRLALLRIASYVIWMRTYLVPENTGLRNGVRSICICTLRVNTVFEKCWKFICFWKHSKNQNPECVFAVMVGIFN